MKKDRPTVALVPGSFDPMTLGHLDVVKRALLDFDEVVVAVMVNPEKKTVFPIERRVAIAEASVSDLARVRVVSDTGFLVALYRKIGADAVCKGYRNETDYDYEMVQDAWNREHLPGFRTVLYRAEGKHAEISSTEVRRRLQNREPIDDLVSPNARALIETTA